MNKVKIQQANRPYKYLQVVADTWQFWVDDIEDSTTFDIELAMRYQSVLATPTRLIDAKNEWEKK